MLTGLKETLKPKCENIDSKSYRKIIENQQDQEEKGNFESEIQHLVLLKYFKVSLMVKGSYAQERARDFK